MAITLYSLRIWGSRIVVVHMLVAQALGLLRVFLDVLTPLPCIPPDRFRWAHASGKERLFGTTAR